MKFHTKPYLFTAPKKKTEEEEEEPYLNLFLTFRASRPSLCLRLA